MSVLRRLGALLLVTVFTLLAAEGIVRAYHAVVPAPAMAPFVPDPHAAFRMRSAPPDIAAEHPDDHINALGFRDRERAVEKRPGTYRILGIGDSFVYGDVPLDHNFLRVAEESLRDRAGELPGEVEMVLMGVGGYSTENELGVLRSIGLELSPDLVVLNFFVGNDVTGIPTRGAVYHGQLYFVGSRSPALNVLRRSRLFVVAERIFLVNVRHSLIRWYHGLRAGTTPAEGDPDVEPEPAAADGGRRDAVSAGYIQIQRRNFPVYLASPDRQMSRLWDEAEGYLREFDLACREAGVPWILLVIPAGVQVDPDLRGRVLEGLGTPPDLYDFESPHRRLRAFARTHGIPLVDPLEPMRELHRADDLLYIPNNTHWNIRGNRIAGEMLSGFIIDWLKQPDGSPRPAHETD